MKKGVCYKLLRLVRFNSKTSANTELEPMNLRACLKMQKIYIWKMFGKESLKKDDIILVKYLTTNTLYY